MKEDIHPGHYDLEIQRLDNGYIIKFYSVQMLHGTAKVAESFDGMVEILRDFFQVDDK